MRDTGQRHDIFLWTPGNAARHRTRATENVVAALDGRSQCRFAWRDGIEAEQRHKAARGSSKQIAGGVVWQQCTGKRNHLLRFLTERGIVPECSEMREEIDQRAKPVECA